MGILDYPFINMHKDSPHSMTQAKFDGRMLAGRSCCKLMMHTRECKIRNTHLFLDIVIVILNPSANV